MTSPYQSQPYSNQTGVNQNQQKPAQTVETSLKFMAWDVKTIGQEIKSLNITIQALTEMLGRHLKENRPNLPPKPPSQNDCPF
jgi:hypothetical protein